MNLESSLTPFRFIADPQTVFATGFIPVDTGLCTTSTGSIERLAGSAEAGKPPT